MNRDIISIFEKYDTDKNSRGHNYSPYYQKHLPETATKILEIGVYHGESIRAWHEIYPEARIFGVDLFEENPYPFQADYVTWIKGSQTDGKLLNEIRQHGVFDFIVEDGSHNSRDQLITFYGLVNSSYLYITEDLHCCKEEFYRQGLDFEQTMLGQMKIKYSSFVNYDYGGFPFHHSLYEDKIGFIY